MRVWNRWGKAPNLLRGPRKFADIQCITMRVYDISSSKPFLSTSASAFHIAMAWRVVYVYWRYYWICCAAFNGLLSLLLAFSHDVISFWCLALSGKSFHAENVHLKLLMIIASRSHDLHHARWWKKHMTRHHISRQLSLISVAGAVFADTRRAHHHRHEKRHSNNDGH